MSTVDQECLKVAQPRYLYFQARSLCNDITNFCFWSVFIDYSVFYGSEEHLSILGKKNRTKNKNIFHFLRPIQNLKKQNAVERNIRTVILDVLRELT